MLHRPFGQPNKTIVHFDELDTVGFEFNSATLREQVRIGNHVWSIQASTLHRCYPQVDGALLSAYREFEISGWDKAAAPVDSQHLDFYGFGLDGRLLRANQSEMVYGVVPRPMLYRIVQHCLMLHQLSSKTQTRTAKLDGMVCVKCATFCPMVESNQPDNTFKCYGCRTFPHYK